MARKHAAVVREVRRQLPLTPGYIVMIIWAIFTFVMIGWIVLASLSTTREIFSGSLLVSGLHFENYSNALFANNVLLNLLNSLLYSASSVAGCVVLCAPLAYALARWRFLGNGLLHKLLVVGLGVPSVMIIMPIFSVVSRLNMSESRMTLILLYIGTSIPFATFFLISFFKNISSSYEEAAAIDGCGPVRTFWTIIFPLAQPGVVTLIIYQFISRWNEYFMANIFANKPRMRPVGVGLYAMIQSMTTTGNWAGMFASVVLVFLPTLLIFILLSKRIMGGVTAGGIKQ